MKWLAIVMFVTGFLGCNSFLENKYVTRTLPLSNNIGTITIDLTSDFDTLHSWKNTSDCKCCHQQHYRFQSKKFPMTEENGWISEQPDSMYGLTITHVFYPECNGADKFDSDEILYRMKSEVWSVNRYAKFKILDKRDINGHDFVACGTVDTNFFKKIIEQKLKAVTFYNNTYIEFEFLKSSSFYTSTTFITESYEMLKTIKIK